MLGRAGKARRRTRRMRRLVAGTAPVVVVAGGLLAIAQPAAADDFEAACGWDCGEGESDDGGISVHVRVSGTTVGEEGYEIPPKTVTVQPPCYYKYMISGEEAWEEGIWSWDSGRFGDPDRFTKEMIREHKDDEGAWYESWCVLDDISLEEAEEWFNNHPPVFVEEGDPVPVPDIPPEVLLEAAEDAMELPDPEVSWNPKRDGDDATLVNVDTWFWLDDGPVQVEVQATAGGNTATVEATLSEMGFSSPGSGSTTCDGFGTEWTPGAEDTDCKLQFYRSSANMPGQVTPVHAESTWDVEWFYNGDPQGPLDGQVTEQDFNVPVAEAQARVVG